MSSQGQQWAGGRQKSESRTPLNFTYAGNKRSPAEPHIPIELHPYLALGTRPIAVRIGSDSSKGQRLEKLLDPSLTLLKRRARAVITRERTREIQRLEKLLEDACIKLSSVASEITGVSGRLMLQALIDGQDDATVLAELAHGRMRAKIPELTEARTGRFSAHHRYMTAMYLRRIDAHSADINDLSDRIEKAMAPFRLARELLVSIPGFSTTAAEVFIAETGADMTVFPTAGQLASWAGTCPGSNESAGRVKSTNARPGNRHLKGALGIAALSVARSNNTYFAAKYRRIASRRGPVKAIVAVERAMLTAAWHMLTTGELYQDPGADYFSLRAPSKTKARAIGQLESLGYKVTIEPSTQAG